jgi:hypothetical protein
MRLRLSLLAATLLVFYASALAAQQPTRPSSFRVQYGAQLVDG